MSENELAKVAVDVAYKVHTGLGPGLLESVYEAAYAWELTSREINYTRQQGISATYNGQSLGMGFRADMVLENKLIVEIKSIERIDKVHHKTVLTYMKLMDVKLGLLINFNVCLIKDGIYRKILGRL